ncbi:FAD-dependent oxidoreductase [Microbacterium sp. ET2]|uniref:FAD-dependent oxidoreductase n=1 Tax=Microbacterium albipurpureum TaxID=3050384 RepID=UPI00259CB06C|nr:FAD-dependent oxidoreductase [Microbacterium sp. ET2 (Ac-2212)]WJL96051.1 FAD-dependent oxidoreductase [Microbacterium sp. ET2 (Ac-2212)]
MAADLLVAGGGVAGLVFARRAALAGHRVRLFEAARVFGGQVSRQDVAGVALDAGAESFATRGGDGPGTVLALLGELGLAGDVVAPAAGSPAWVQEQSDRTFPLPAAGLLGIPTDLDETLLPALGAAGLARARQDATLPPDQGATAETLGALVRARMGDRVLDALVAPVVRGVHSTTPDALPIDSASPRLREEFRRTGSLAAAIASIRATSPAGSQVAGVRGGVFRLVDALVADAAAHGAEPHQRCPGHRRRPGRHRGRRSPHPRHPGPRPAAADAGPRPEDHRRHPRRRRARVARRPAGHRGARRCRCPGCARPRPDPPHRQMAVDPRIPRPAGGGAAVV